MIPAAPRLTRILIVDDKPKGLEDRILAEVRHCRVETVPGGEEAVARLLETVFDIILCDLKLQPGFNGVEVTRQAREIQRSARVVIYTGKNADMKKEAFEAGAFAYLGKPINFDELLHIIEVINDIRRTEQLGEGFRALAAVSSRLQESFDFSSVAERIVEGACSLGYRRARLYLYEPIEEVLVGKAACGDHPGVDFEGYQIPVGAVPLVAEIFDRVDPMICTSKALREEGFGDDALEPWVTDLGLEQVSWIDCPLRVKNRRIGTLAVDHLGAQDTALTRDDVEIVRVLAGLAAQALANSRAYEKEAVASASMKSILEEAPDAIITTDLHGVITFASPSSQAITGLPPQDLVGQPAHRFYTDEAGSRKVGREIAQHLMSTVREKEKISNQPFHVVNQDGPPRKVAASISMLHDRDGNEVGTLGQLKDLSPLESQSRRYQDLLEGFGYGSVLLDRKGQVEFINPKGKGLLHVEDRELQGEEFAQFVHTAHREKFKAAFQRVVGEAKEEGLDLSIVRSDGSGLPLQVRMSPIRPARKVTGVALALYDKSELNALKQSGRLMALGQLIAGVNHEIRNPLNNISANLVVLEEELRDAGIFRGENIDTFRRVQGNARRITRILDRMKTFARPEELKLEPLRLADLVSDALIFFDRHLKNQNIQLERDIPRDLPWMLADRTGLMQVFVALIVNAEEAMEGQDGPKKIAIAGRAEGDRIRVSFRDTGPGIPEEIRDSVFDLFFTTKLAGKGTGLGLSICREILQMVGGTIRVEDGGNGWGACFLIELSVARKPERND